MSICPSLRREGPRTARAVDELVVHKIAQFGSLDDYKYLHLVNRMFAKIVQKLIYQTVVIDFKFWKKGYRHTQINENRPVSLPESLQTVIFGGSFNQPA